MIREGGLAGAVNQAFKQAQSMIHLNGSRFKAPAGAPAFPPPPAPHGDLDCPGL